jgi:hypothetical protein
MAAAMKYVQLTMFGRFAATAEECVLGWGLLAAAGGRTPQCRGARDAKDDPTFEFVLDEGAEKGNVVSALAELLIDLVVKG